MATKKPIKVNLSKVQSITRRRPPEPLLPGRNVRAQSIKDFAAEVAKRRDDQARPGNTLLKPDEVAGEYLLERGLMTTLGGVARPITYDDLKHFQRNVSALRKDASKRKLLGGIRAKQAIDRSWSADVARAQREIPMANPAAYRAVTETGGQSTTLVVTFMTSAGPESDRTHHTCNVQFLDFGAMVASPAKADVMAAELAKSRLKFECSCGRFKYWLRYLCTQLEVCYGRTENAFPKIRNPSLGGMACKHLLRVMQTIRSSGAFKAYAARTIQKFRDDISHVAGVERIADQREFERQRKADSYARRRVESAEMRKARLQRQPGYAKQQAKAKEKAAAKEKARLQRDRAKAIAGVERSAKELLRLGVINQQQYDQMLATAKGST